MQTGHSILPGVEIQFRRGAIGSAVLAQGRVTVFCSLYYLGEGT
jgi:hypothetical protein